MNSRPIPTASFVATVLVVLCSVSPAATTTNTDIFAGFTMDFVDITGGNNADDTGYGAVTNDYRMGKYEVSGAMIDAYNANSGGPAITRYAPFSASQPAALSWNEAARFVNWLNVSTGHSPAYNYDSGSILGNDNIALWTAGDAGYDASNPFRNSNAYYFLPSENEWYRAAYYAPSGGVYYDYATGSDTAPTAVTGGTANGTAVYIQPFGQGPADTTNAGGLSPFGTMGQNGNVWEWGESRFTAPNDTAVESRVFRGGDWFYNSNPLQSSSRYFTSPSSEGSNVGFRVAAVPEPSGLSLFMLSALGLLVRRKR